MFVINSRSPVCLNLAVLVAIAETGDRIERASFRHFLAGEIKFLAPDPIDGRRRLQRFRRQHRRVRADKTDGRLGPVRP